jgi:hypothetical protein
MTKIDPDTTCDPVFSVEILAQYNLKKKALTVADIAQYNPGVPMLSISVFPIV